MSRPTPELRHSVSDALASKRELSASTLRTYTSLLSNTLVKLGQDSPEYLSKHVDQVLAHIDKLESAQTRKTTLSALVVLTGDSAYSKAMLANIATVAAKYKEQRVDPDRVAKLKTMNEIRQIHANLMAAYKKSPTQENTVNVLISGMMSGVYEGTPPRRLMDYTEMQISDFDKKTDNYVGTKTFVFHKYKTSNHDRKKGIDGAELPIPLELRTIINKWKKVNECSYLLVNNKDQKFTSSTLNKRLTSIYNFGCDMLRSIFLSDRYKNLPALIDMEKTAAGMSHSVDSALLFYTKKGV